MLKTYRIIPLVFILFLFGLTLITEAPVFAQGKWDKSMGMRHPDRPCMDRARVPGGCGRDMRSPAQIASDPYDTNNPISQAARANGAGMPPIGNDGGISKGASGGEVAQLNARIAELEAENTRLLARHGEPDDPTSQKMVRQRDARIRSLTQILRQKMTENTQWICELKVKRQRDTREWRQACDRNSKGKQRNLPGRKSLCSVQRALQDACWGEIWSQVDGWPWSERYEDQLSSIQSYHIRWESVIC